MIFLQRLNLKRLLQRHIFIFCVAVLLFPSKCLSLEEVSKRENSWWNDVDSELGELCQSDNDTVGQHLGCNCQRYTDTDVMLKADCAKKWIGFNETLLLPPRLNVSLHVRILDLSRNYITAVDMQTFGACEGVQTLLLNDNSIQSFQGVACPRVMKLDLSRNQIKNLTAEALKGIPRLVEINLSFNELLFLEPNTFEQLTNLRSLSLASNSLGLELFYTEEYMLSLTNLKNLEDLDISNCSLPDFPQYLINGTRNLKRLVLRDNLITSIASGVFEEFLALRVLDLSGNIFEEIVPNNFVSMSSLHVLKLDKMRPLTAIREYAFSGLVHLHELSCQMNYHLTSIDSKAFRGDPEMIGPNENASSLDCRPKIVRLGDNDLHFIDYPLLSWKDVEILELHRNSWICDCNLQWVSDFYRHKQQEAAILADSYFSCYEPHIFAGVPVVHVNPEEMLCFSPAATVAGTIGIVIFGILLFSFCSVIILNQMGMLPDWVRQYNIFGSGSNLPTYMRVYPRQSTKARRMVERVQAIPELHCYSVGSKNRDQHHDNEPIPDELEWDNGDIGRT